MITVQCFECGPVATNGYLVTDTSAGTAWVVDVPYGSCDLYMQAAAAAGCTIAHILLTHTHWDHTADCAPLQRATGATVYVHEADVYRLVEPMKYTIWPLTFTIEPVEAYVLLGNVLELPGARLKVMHTPGHTEGGVCFVHEESETVFVGDTLFNGSVGRTDLPGGDMPTLMNAIKSVLFTLPDSFVALPGHGPATTIGNERMHNPFVGEHAYEL